MLVHGGLAVNKLSASLIGLLVWCSVAPAHAAPDIDAAPPFKALPLGREVFLTLSAEARLRYDSHGGRQFASGNDSQGLFRGILGADLRLNPSFRVYGEIGTGQVAGRRGAATPNFQNDASLQQLF